MATHNYDYRFELKPGKFVYIQQRVAIKAARRDMRRVFKRYDPDDFFFHLHKRGGHVAALRLHKPNKFFSRFDIQNFFGQVTRTKVARALREIGFKKNEAFYMAMDAVVVEGDKKIIPYGFCQSPLFATLALEKSQLGSALRAIRDSGGTVSVYMDDILISGDEQEALAASSNVIIDAAKNAGFPFSPTKMALAQTMVQSFNCELEEEKITIEKERMAKFVSDHAAANDGGKAAIEKYITSINDDELERFFAMMTVA